MSWVRDAVYFSALTVVFSVVNPPLFEIIGKNIYLVFIYQVSATILTVITAHYFLRGDVDDSNRQQGKRYSSRTIKENEA